jgi:hypothetical protein
VINESNTGAETGAKDKHMQFHNKEINADFRVPESESSSGCTLVSIYVHAPVTITQVYIEAKGSNRLYPTPTGRLPITLKSGYYNHGFFNEELMRQLEQDNIKKESLKICTGKIIHYDNSGNRTEELRYSYGDFFQVRAIVVTSKGNKYETEWYPMPLRCDFVKWG